MLLLPNVRLPKKTVKSRLFGVRPDKGNAIIYSGERICGEIAAKPSSGQGPVPELFFIKQRAGRSAEVLKNLPPFTPTPSWAPALPPPGLAHASLGIIVPKVPLSFTAAFMKQWNKGYGSSKYSRDQEFEVAARPLGVACGLPLIRGCPVAMKGSRRRSSISPPLAFYSLRGCFNVDLCKNSSEISRPGTPVVWWSWAPRLEAGFSFPGIILSPANYAEQYLMIGGCIYHTTRT